MQSHKGIKEMQKKRCGESEQHSGRKNKKGKAS